MDEKEKEAKRLLAEEIATLRMYRGGEEPTRARAALELLCLGIEKREKDLDALMSVG
ncbi:MAG: hypothetical protein MUQ25_03835 [Candidatus Aminicenantes bacterium]|nr:hypothetical protein [Candidatus Aminicenantes bacterium]